MAELRKIVMLLRMLSGLPLTFIYPAQELTELLERLQGGTCTHWKRRLSRRAPTAVIRTCRERTLGYLDEYVTRP